jgi:WD40 repeat protein
VATSPPDKETLQAPDVFISYSRKDKEFARRLDEELTRRGREAWVDWEGIRPTEEFMQAIYGAIEGADTFVFVLTPDSVASEVCGREIAHAAAHNKRMVPIVARDVNAKTVPETLAKLNWIFCREADDFQQATDTLVTALETDLEWVHAHTRLLTRALEWEANRKSNSFVLRGEDLRSGEQWLAQAGADKDRQPTVLQTEYIIRSRKAAAKRQRILWGSVSGALIVTGIFAVAAYFQNQAARLQRQIAGARQLATQAELLGSRRADGLQSSAVMAVQSLRQFRTLEADQVLRRALGLLAQPVTRFASRKALKNAGFISGENMAFVSRPLAAFSSDARLAALVLADDSVELREVQSHRLIATMKHASPVNALQFSPDGKLLATVAGTDAQVWETERGKAVIPVIQLSQPINTLAMSADGRFIVTGSEDQTAQISPLSSSTGIQKQTLKPIDPLLSGPVDAIAISPDSKYVATSRREELTLWEATTGQRVNPAAKPVSHNRHPRTLVFSPDGTMLASAGNDNAVHVLDTASGGERFVVPQFYKVMRVGFSPHGTYLATTSGDMAARIWETEAPHRMTTTVIHEGQITDFAFSPDERFFATASEDSTARVWAIDSGQEMLRITHQGAVRAVAYDPDGSSLATVGDDGMVARWKSKTGAEIARNLQPGSSSGFRFSRDGRCVVTIVENMGASLWDPATGSAIAIFPDNGAPVFVMTDDLRLVATASGDTAEVWDVASRKLVTTLRHDPPVGEVILDRPDLWNKHTNRPDVSEWERRGSVKVSALSADGRFLVTRRFEDEGRVWEPSSGRERWRFKDFTGPALARFSPDSNLLAVANHNSVRIFEAYSGKEKAVLSGAPRVDIIAFSIDSHRLAAAGDKFLRIWDVTGKKIAELKHEAAISGPLVCSVSTPFIAITDEHGVVSIWNAEDGSNVDTIAAHGAINSVAFSPDGTLLATAGEDFTARVYDVRKRRELAVFHHLDAVLTVSFSGDGKLVVTGSRDQTARVWNIQANEEMVVINHPRQLGNVAPSICAATLSPDAHYLVTGESSGMARVWPLRPAELIKQAAARITRPLTNEERKALYGEP